MEQGAAECLAALRSFNYERIYTRPESIAQGNSVVTVLRALVEYFIENPDLVPAGSRQRSFAGSELGEVRSAVAYVAGMTDRYAFDMALDHLGWSPGKLPLGIDLPAFRLADEQRGSLS
jgi:dGTPase